MNVVSNIVGVLHAGRGQADPAIIVGGVE